MAVISAICSDIESRNSPSFYAASVAWGVVQLVESLVHAEAAFSPHQTGLIVASDECSLETIRELASTAARGKISPLRFAGASPSIVAGVSALQQGIRGPTLCLTMPPQTAAGAILAMLRFWMAYSGVSSVIIVAHNRHGDGSHLFKGLIARSVDVAVEQQIIDLCNS